MALPQFSALHHWYSARLQALEGVSLATRITDFCGKGRHGSRIGTLISIVANWFNFGETSGGGDNGILPPSLPTATGSYSWIARVRRGGSANWPSNAFPILLGTTDSQGRCVTYTDGNNINLAHSGFGDGINWGNQGVSTWTVDDTHIIAFSFDAATTTGRCYHNNLTTPTVTDTALTANNSAASSHAWFRWASGQSWGHEASDCAIWPGVALTAAELQAALAYFDLAISSLSPADGATNVSVNTTLQITFSTVPQIGTGNLTVTETGVGTFEVVDITDTGQVSIAGNVLTVTLSGPLGGGKNYDVTWPGGVIVGDPGISSATTWNFTTESTGVDGTAAVTEGADQAAGSGAVSTSAVGTASDGEDTTSGAAAVSTAGAGSTTEGADQAAATGAAAVGASGSVTESDDVASGAAAAAVGGSGATTDEGDSVQGSGGADLPTIEGSALVADEVDGVSGTAAVSTAGTGASSDEGDAVAATGQASVEGTGAAADAEDGTDGTGAVSVSGAAAIEDEGDSVQASDAVEPVPLPFPSAFGVLDPIAVATGRLEPIAVATGSLQ